MSVPVSMQSVSVISTQRVQPGEEMYFCSRSCITLQLFLRYQGDEDETCLEYLSRTTKVMRMKCVQRI